MRAMSKLQHRLHVLLYPSKDLPGQWVAHCLEIDLVTQGNDQGHALEMIAEAIETVAEDNVSRGGAPLLFRSAPKDDWERLRKATPLNITRIVHLDGKFPDEVTLAPNVVARSAG